MSRPRGVFDPRLTLARTDLAAASLEGIVAAGRYEASRPMRVIVPVAPLRCAPDPAGERVDELLYGEAFEALADDGDFVWGQARRDGYVGFVPAAALAPAGAPPTHRVAALRTDAFAGPSIHSAANGPFSLNALVRIEAEDGPFGRAADGGWFPMEHLAPIGRFEPDPAAVAERFLGAPYLQGGRTSAGLDGAALIQQALYACGRGFPRDADQQLAEGRDIARGELARGDLAGWRGHVGLLLDACRLIHASADHSAVVIEPLDGVTARFERAGRGPMAFRRL
jgi:cell wall-associated NlpC family hydrolase